MDLSESFAVILDFAFQIFLLILKNSVFLQCLDFAWSRQHSMLHLVISDAYLAHINTVLQYKDISSIGIESSSMLLTKWYQFFKIRLFFLSLKCMTWNNRCWWTATKIHSTDRVNVKSYLPYERFDKCKSAYGYI